MSRYYNKEEEKKLPSSARGAEEGPKSSPSPPLDEKQRLLSELFDSAYSKDAVLLVGPQKEEVRAHKSILAANSVVFRNMFYTTQMKESAGSVSTVEIPDSDPESMNSLVYYCYQQQLPKSLTIESTFPVMSLAEKYHVVGLKGMLTDFLMRGITEKNCAKIFSYADAYPFAREVADAAFGMMLGSDAITGESIFSGLSKENMLRVVGLLMQSINPNLLATRILEYARARPAEALEKDEEIRGLLGKILETYGVKGLGSQNTKELLRLGIADRDKVFEELLKANDSAIATQGVLADDIASGMIFHIYRAPGGEPVVERFVIQKPWLAQQKWAMHPQQIYVLPPLTNSSMFGGAPAGTVTVSPATVALVKQAGVKLQREGTERYWHLHASNMRVLYINYKSLVLSQLCMKHRTVHQGMYDFRLSDRQLQMENVSIVVEERGKTEYVLDEVGKERGECLVTEEQAKGLGMHSGKKRHDRR